MEKENAEKAKKIIIPPMNNNTNTNTNNNTNNIRHGSGSGNMSGDNVLLTKSVISDIEKFSSRDYIPNKVNKSIQLPISKNSKEYKKLKEEIISNIEDGMCELEYFHMDYGMEHVETALYYLKNITD